MGPATAQLQTQAQQPFGQPGQPAPPAQPQPQNIQALGQAWEANPVGPPPAGYNSPYANAVMAQQQLGDSRMQGATALPAAQQATLQSQIDQYHNSPAYQNLQPQQPTSLAGAMTNTTNMINQTGGGAPGSPLSPGPTIGGPGSTPGTTGGGAPGPGASSGTGATPPTSGGLLQQLQQQVNQQQNPFNLLQGRETALGIPAAQQQVSGLRQAITDTTNLLNQIAPSVEGRTANSLVNSAQATRMIGNEQAPVQTNLQNLNTQEGNAQNILQNLLSQATNEANMQAQGQQQNITNLSSLEGMAAAGEAAKQAQTNFTAQQAQAAEQFQKDLALKVQQFGLSQQQRQDAVDQFNTSQSNQAAQFYQNMQLQLKQYNDQINIMNSNTAWQRGLDVFNQSQSQQKQASDTSIAQQKLDDTASLNQAKIDELNAIAALKAAQAGGGGNTATGYP